MGVVPASGVLPPRWRCGGAVNFASSARRTEGRYENGFHLVCFRWSHATHKKKASPELHSRRVGTESPAHIVVRATT